MRERLRLRERGLQSIGRKWRIGRIIRVETKVPRMPQILLCLSSLVRPAFILSEMQGYFKVLRRMACMILEFWRVTLTTYSKRERPEGALPEVGRWRTVSDTYSKERWHLGSIGDKKGELWAHHECSINQNHRKIKCSGWGKSKCQGWLWFELPDRRRC